MAESTTNPKTDSSGQTAEQLASQAGLTTDTDKAAVAANEAEGQNPDAAVGSALMEKKKEPDVPAMTSDLADAQAETTGAAVTTAASGLNQRSEDAYTQAFDLLDKMAKTSAQDRADSIANIERQREIDLADTKTGQRLEAGTTSRRMARIGGYLGGSGSSVAYMNSLSQSHQLEVTKIQAMYAAAVEKAKVAYSMKDMELASKLMDAADGYQNQLEKKRTNDMDLAIKATELAKFERATDLATLGAWAEQGYEVDDIPDGMFEQMDKGGKYKAGTSKGLYSFAKREKEIETSEQQLKFQSDLYKFLGENIKPSETVEIGGKIYHGQKKGSDYLGYQIDKSSGDVTIIEQDTTTGKVSFNKQKGVLTPNVEYSIEKFKDGSFHYVPVNPNDGPSIPVMTKDAGAGVNTNKLFTDYPAGQKPMGTEHGWCLETAYQWADPGSIPTTVDGLSMDTIEAKRSWADESIKVENVSAGMWVLTNEDKKWGHIALIRDVYTDDNGEKYAVLSESNGPGSAGVVNHTRTMKLTPENMEDKGGKIMGFHRAELRDSLTAQSSKPLVDIGNTSGFTEQEQKDKDAMEKDIRDWVAKLSERKSAEGSTGELWGQAWNYIKTAYKVPDEYNFLIDQYLNKKEFFPS